MSKMHLLARKGEISRRSDIRIQQAVPVMRWLRRTNMSAIHVQDTQNVHPNYGLGIRRTIVQSVTQHHAGQQNKPKGIA